jgi:hypothetical protein
MAAPYNYTIIAWPATGDQPPILPAAGETEAAPSALISLLPNGAAANSWLTGEGKSQAFDNNRFPILVLAF